MAQTEFPFFPDHWYYNTETGQLTKGNNLENLGNNLLGGLGWHELNIPGNATEAQAAAEAKKEFPHGKEPTTAGITPARVAQVAAQQAGASGVPGLSQIGAFFGNLGNPHMWLRIAEGILGILLIATAVSKLAEGSAIGQAARKIPLVA
jgi:hypothetical protein